MSDVSADQQNSTMSRSGEHPPTELAILIVDDDAGIRSSLSRILRADGYRIDVAESAAEAIDSDHWTDYFAILLDRRLPDHSAEDLLPRIIKRAPDAAVLIITGYGDLESSMAAIRAGAADYLLKPVDPDELRVRLRRFAELKQARDELRQRDQQIRFMINHLPAGAAYVNADTGHVRVNETIERMTGFSAGDLQTLEQWFQTLFGDEHDAYHKAYLEDRQAGFPKSRVVPIRRRDGTQILGEFSGYRYDHHEVWLINDITERERAREEVRHQRDFLERLVDTAQVIVLVLDVDGRVIQFNRFMQELSGYRLDDVVGRNWFDTFLPEDVADNVRRLFTRVVDGEEVRGHVNAIVTREGRERQIAWWANSLRDADGQVTEVLSIGHDVTYLQDVQEKLVQSERLAAIGQMITGLTHESRNALQRARACLDMLSLDLTEQPQQLKLTGRIQTALDELQRLYEEVRSYAAPIRLSLGMCDLADVWQTSWRNVLETQGATSVSFREDAADVETRCIVDRHRIEQVVRNVLENALAASPPHGRVTLSCQECEIDNRPGVRLVIVDDGSGLTPEQAERVFEPFFTTKQKGTGLGMPIAKRIVEAHGGTITVAGASSRGAEIVITLPRSSR